MNTNFSFKNLFGLSFVILMLIFSIVISQEVLAAGLKVNVSLYHSNNGSTRVCVSSVYQNLGCRIVTLSGVTNPYIITPFIFGDNIIPVGGQFKACATNLATNAFRCATGTNSLAKTSESVSITVPTDSTGEGRINWLNICRIPVVDALLSEPCETLTTPDGYTLTKEGERVVGCVVGLFGGSAALMIADPSGSALGTAQQLGLSRAVGCKT